MIKVRFQGWDIMEYLLGLLLVFNNSLSALGLSGTHLLYIFSGAILIWYVFKRSMLVKSIGEIFLFFVAYALISHFITGASDKTAIAVFLIHTLLNITLTIWVINELEHLDIEKLVFVGAILHFILWVIALFTPGSLLWQHAEYMTGTKAMRLKLLYNDAAELSVVCGVFLLLCVYRLVHKISWKTVVSSAIFLLTMFLSYGMTGIISVAIAMLILLFAYISNNRNQLAKDFKSKIKWISIMTVALAIILTIAMLSPIYGLRIGNLFMGTDTAMAFEITNPFRAFIEAMHVTNWRGVGFGGLSISGVGNVIGYSRPIKNSFLNVMINGGALGVLLVVVLVAFLIIMCLFYGNVLNVAFLTYILIVQIVLGTFDGPLNWFVYGLILADCMKTRAVLEEKRYY
ncbi:hypothetical protein [Butyrivibrio sp. WCE2006]|uniref:hypothetical protein n=1 Tax=Butyrivibrio sp. WCE2006 TaxID=1410611 RepID=UPI0012DD9B92|nr:hypothetical protein [Butyrivibrio sp. WCE2006]